MNESLVDPTQFKILEVYVHYDRPLLFCCQNILGHKYLAVLVEEEEENETWLYVALSERRFEMVRSGGIDLATAFAKPEGSEAIVVTVPFDETLVSWKTISESEIITDWLPVPGERLNLATQTMKETITRRASQAYREAITLRLDFRQYNRTEAPASGLGEILIAFQDAVASMTNALALMKVVGFNPGSFEVELEADEQADFFKHSPTGEALNELLQLFNESEDPEALMQKLKELPPKATDKFSKFMRTISQQTSNAQIIWGSPREDYGGRMQFSAEQANDVWKKIQETDQPRITVLDTKGILRGIDLDTRHFRIVDVNGKVYYGYVDKDSIDDQIIQNARIRDFYTVSIKETYTPQAAGEEPKLKYELLSLIPASST